VPGTLLVTGASRGIGASIARRAAAEVEGAGRRALVIHADVAREADVQGAFAAVDGEFGRPDAVAINAGITGSFTRRYPARARIVVRRQPDTDDRQIVDIGQLSGHIDRLGEIRVPPVAPEPLSGSLSVIVRLVFLRVPCVVQLVQCERAPNRIGDSGDLHFEVP
jgi:hypothetical protein